MAKNLLIVESPAKAKTIEKYLGEDFIVRSSYGHVRDLEKGKKGISIENGFEPSYVVSPEKVKIVDQLIKEVKGVEEVWLATDEDREGEAISWHLCKVLGLDEHTTKRIVFREITKSAIQKAITEPRTVDLNIVNAQKARRILDRLVGFELSGVLWRKIRNKLSAGRVQSVAVKLIVEREREITKFEAEPFFRVVALFNVTNEAGKTVILKADLSDRLKDEKEATEFLESCKSADFTIDKIDVKPRKRKPTAPFITSTLQQEASRKLYFGVKRTMSVAQKLYEQGHITYMRTDSKNLSKTAIDAISEEILNLFGDKYLQNRTFKSKDSTAQEAHEAIRPTNFSVRSVGAESDQQRLYELIWNRTMASQMADAELEKTNVSIKISTQPERKLKATGEVMKFDGFMKVYMESKDEDDSGEETKGILPPLKEGQLLDLKNITTTERFTRPSNARFTEASLVKKMEELGIGRPSTYAPTISKIMEAKRGYITKESREGVERKYRNLILENGEIVKEDLSEMTGATSNRLYPSDLGMLVTDFLDEHFEDIMQYNFTADIEEKFDVIANGKLKWDEMIKSFYVPFHSEVEHTIEHAERAKGKRILGKDAVNGHSILVQMTRFGPVAQIGDREEMAEDEKPIFASLKPGQSIETINLEEVMELFKLPREMDPYDGLEVSIRSGRFGPYIKFGEAFISIPKDEDPISMERARVEELIEQKKKEDAPVTHYEEKPVTQGAGRFGPFLKWDGIFINIPRKYDPDNLTEKEMHELIAAKIEKEANRYIHRWDKEKTSVENGRWGPLIKHKRIKLNLRKEDGTWYTKEEAEKLTFEDAKELINLNHPGTIK